MSQCCCAHKRTGTAVPPAARRGAWCAQYLLPLGHPARADITSPRQFIRSPSLALFDTRSHLCLLGSGGGSTGGLTLRCRSRDAVHEVGLVAEGVLSPVDENLLELLDSELLCCRRGEVKGNFLIRLLLDGLLLMARWRGMVRSLAIHNCTFESLYLWDHHWWLAARPTRGDGLEFGRGRRLLWGGLLDAALGLQRTWKIISESKTPIDHSLSRAGIRGCSPQIWRQHGELSGLEFPRLRPRCPREE